MSQSPLYEEDIYAWAHQQARVLRGLACAGLPLPNEFDLEHVAEEIEDLGNEQRFQVESNLEQALIHLIKIVSAPEDQAVRHWTKEVGAFLHNAKRRYRASMRRAIDDKQLWADVCLRATRDIEIDGGAVPALPDVLPFTLEELVSGADPRMLVRRLSALISGEPK